MKLYHVTTPKKARLYRASGRIISPVRGFTTLLAAMAWAIKTHRTVIVEIEAQIPYKLPDHHNEFGEAWWNDGDITEWKRVYSADDTSALAGEPRAVHTQPNCGYSPGQTFLCHGCCRDVCWCMGGNDEYPGLCDDCVATKLDETR